MRLTVLAPVLAALGLSACAQPGGPGISENIVQFNSVPAGAAVTTSLGQSCETPCELIVSRRVDFDTTFALGDAERVVRVESVTDAGVVASSVLFAGGPLGVAMHAATGTLFKHDPNPVNVTFSDEEVVAAERTEPPAASPPVVPDTADFTPVAGAGPLTEGSPYAFTETQIASFCAQDWTKRTNSEGRTEYNPCTERSAFR
ncbi:MAG: hypothetical protein AAF416_13120 [Pseudomonadota bacterium]